jgi:hypothetical protein
MQKCINMYLYFRFRMSHIQNTATLIHKKYQTTSVSSGHPYVLMMLTLILIIYARTMIMRALVNMVMNLWVP